MNIVKNGKIYYLIGPSSQLDPTNPNITEGTGQVMITINQGSDVYFLTATSDSLVFINSNNISGTPLVLTVTSANGGVTLSYQSSQGTTSYIGVDSSTQIARPSDEAYVLVPTVADGYVNQWDTFLIGVGYILMYQGYSLLWNIDTGTDSSSTVSNIRFLPTARYEASTCCIISGLASVVNAEVDFFSGTDVPDGYVQLSDCITGVRYDYCTEGRDCAGNCRGPCPITEPGMCLYNNSTKVFKCTIPIPEDYKIDALVVLGIVVTIIILIIIILIIK